MPIKRKKKAPKAKVCILCIQDATGQIKQVLSSENYDLLLIEGLDICKETGNFYTIFDTLGREIDTNFTKKHKERKNA